MTWERKIHFRDPQTGREACGYVAQFPGHSTRHLEEATCKVCIKLVTVGHR